MSAPVRRRPFARSGPLVRAAALALAPALVPVLALGGLSSCGVTRALRDLASSPEHVAKTTDPAQKDARLAVLWIGHSSVLVQIDDKFILTDPIFTSTVGQLDKRLVEPGLDPEHLPPVDAVLVSNVTFDHLSLGSLARIQGKVRQLLVPEGATSYVTDFGFPTTELPTWRSWGKDGLVVTAVPTTPAGGRYGIDDAWSERASTAFVVSYHGLTVYFSGDGAYDVKNFVATSERFPNVDLALLPVGPIEPRASMRRFHMSPHESIRALFDLGARWMVPIHYGTFAQGDDRPGDVEKEIARVVANASLGEREVRALAIGAPSVFLKKGEEPAPVPEPSPPAEPAPPPAPAPPSTSPRDEDDDHGESSIPDDERLD